MTTEILDVKLIRDNEGEYYRQIVMRFERYNITLTADYHSYIINNEKKFKQALIGKRLVSKRDYFIQNHDCVTINFTDSTSYDIENVYNTDTFKGNSSEFTYLEDATTFGSIAEISQSSVPHNKSHL